MKAVKVEYTVKPEFAAQNKENIKKVMSALKERPIEGMLFATYTDAARPYTFIHINISKDAETMAKLSTIKEFKEFRVALKASDPIMPPQRIDLDPVGASFELK